MPKIRQYKNKDGFYLRTTMHLGGSGKRAIVTYQLSHAGERYLRRRGLLADGREIDRKRVKKMLERKMLYTGGSGAGELESERRAAAAQQRVKKEARKRSSPAPKQKPATPRAQPRATRTSRKAPPQEISRGFLASLQKSLEEFNTNLIEKPPQKPVPAQPTTPEPTPNRPKPRRRSPSYDALASELSELMERQAANRPAPDTNAAQSVSRSSAASTTSHEPATHLANSGTSDTHHAKSDTATAEAETPPTNAETAVGCITLIVIALAVFLLVRACMG